MRGRQNEQKNIADPSGLPGPTRTRFVTVAITMIPKVASITSSPAIMTPPQDGS